MKRVIDISEDDYRKVQDGRASVSMMRKSIRNGIPLPKGHGKIVDATEVWESGHAIYRGDEQVGIQIDADAFDEIPVLIEADKEGVEE